METITIPEGQKEFVTLFSKLPDTVKQTALDVLRDLVGTLPSAAEYHLGADNPEKQTVFEKRYGDIADHFARRIDPSFDPRALHWEKETQEARSAFYHMIRTYTGDQIQGILPNIQLSKD